MKVMISQPMRGRTNEEIRREREELVKELESQGYEVIDTIFGDCPINVFNKPLWYLAKSIEAMSNANGVIFMKDWKLARGCVLEHQIAEIYGLFIKEL